MGTEDGTADAGRPEGTAAQGAIESAYGVPGQRRPELVPDFIRSLPRGTGEVALFDADGCLWLNDVADDFTLWMIAEGHVSGDRWDEYQRIYRADAPAGCRYLLSFYSGLPIARIRELVDEYWLRHASRQWIPEVVESLFWVADRGYGVFVVSGTPTDFLLPLGRVLPVEQILGMDFELDPSGRVTGRHAGISCAAEGKAEKSLLFAQGRRIRLACGNGPLDTAMMALADVAWAIYPSPELEAEARGRGWAVLPRPPGFVEEAKLRRIA